MGLYEKICPPAKCLWNLDEAGTLTMGNPMPEVEGMQDHQL